MCSFQPHKNNHSHDEIVQDMTFYMVVKLVAKGGVVGLVAGFFAATFRYALWYAEEIRLTIVPMTTMYSYAGWVLFLMLVGCAVMACIRWEPLCSGSGIPQVKGEMLGLYDMRPKRVLLGKCVAGSLTSLAGFSLGREGPSIQVGAAAGKWMARLFKSSFREERILTSAGAAAGLTAAFSVPISGVLFIFEEVHKKFYPILMIPTFTAAFVSNVVTSSIFGLEPTLGFTIYEGLPLFYFPLLVILGVFSGLMGYVFNKVLLRFKVWYGRILLPSGFKMVISFALVGMAGLVIPDLMGGGHLLVYQMIHHYGQESIFFLLFLLFGKIFFTASCYATGVPGGIFLPILVIGSATGAVFFSLCNIVGGVPYEFLGNFVLCAMGGILASSIHSPLLSMLLVLEITQSFSNTFAVGVVTITAFLVAEGLKLLPIYEALLAMMKSTMIKEKRNVTNRSKSTPRNSTDR